MNTETVGGAQRGKKRTRGWSPLWAVVTAGVGSALALVPLWLGIALLGKASPTGGWLGGLFAEAAAPQEGLALALGQFAVLASVLVLALLGWFLVRGGRLPFLVGTQLVAVGLLGYGTIAAL